MRSRYRGYRIDRGAKARYAVTLITKTPERWFDALVSVIAIAYGLAIWWPTRSLPYYWDSATFVVDAARDLVRSRYSPLVASHSDFAHPPLFVAAVAVLWQVLGEARVVSHALVFPALPALLIATYRLGRRVGDRAVGAASAIAVGGVAVVVAEYGEVYMDLPIAALLTWGLLAWLDGRWLVAGVLWCASAAMKIPAPLTVPVALGACLLADRARRRDARAWLALAAPIVLVAAWLAYHRAVTGWTLSQRAVNQPGDLAELAAATGTVLEWTLLGEWRWLVLGGALAAVLWVRLQSGEWLAVSRVAELLAVIGVAGLFFGVVGEFGLRYGIFMMPPYFVSAFFCIRPVTRGPLPIIVGSLALFGVFLTTWHPAMPLTTALTVRPDENLAYRDVISVGVRSARWLEEKHPDAEIYGAGPEAYELSEPWQGYVTRPLRYFPCKAFERHPGTEQLIIVHPYDRQQPVCLRVTNAVAAPAIKQFHSNAKWLEIHAVPSG